jgi:hypothetical protein
MWAILALGRLNPFGPLQGRIFNSLLTRFSMDDLWANPPFGSWHKVAVAWRGLRSERDARCRTPHEARTLVVLALQDWLVAEFSKWITRVLLLATLIPGMPGLSKQIGGRL